MTRVPKKYARAMRLSKALDKAEEKARKARAALEVAREAFRDEIRRIIAPKEVTFRINRRTGRIQEEEIRR